MYKWLIRKTTIYAHMCSNTYAYTHVHAHTHTCHIHPYYISAFNGSLWNTKERNKGVIVR